MAIQEGEVSYDHPLLEQYADICNSAFIRDLITFPSDQSLESTPIELDHTSKIARYFIDFVMSGSTSTAQISMKEFEELFQLSDKFVTEKVDQALLVAIELRVQHLLASKRADPWAIFRLATARDHPELARAIIRAFECDFPTLASASSMSRSSTASLAATLEPSCLLDTIPDTLTTTTITP